MIELRHLRYLIAVADEGHITRAAERLGIQQPPLTRQIHSLEAQLGVQLFERLPRGVRLTEAGAVLVEEARAIVARTEHMADTAGRAARGEQGRIAVGYTSSAAFHPFVTREIRAFRRARPAVQLALAEDGTPELLRALRDERLDAAFIRSSASDSDGLRIDPLMDEPMLAALPAEHELAQGKTGAAGASAIPLAALAGETFILYRRPSGPGLYDAIIAACHAAGFSPTVGQEAPRMPSTLSLVAAGIGVSIVPASMRRLNMEGVAYLSLTDCPDLHAPLLLATRRAEHSPVVARFRHDVRAAARDGG